MTYSIVARDPATGEMGVATQSQAFAVGNSVPFALPGHGVIATQSMAEPMYGSVGLDLLQGGFTAQEVLTALSSVDPQPEPAAGRRPRGERRPGRLHRRAVRGRGRPPASGTRAWRWPTWPRRRRCGSRWSSGSRAPAGRSPSGCSPRCRPAEEAGGDFRGRRSAAIMVIRATTTGRPWHDTVVDLRVDDSADPITALGRAAGHPGPLPGRRPRTSSRPSTATRSPPTASSSCCGRWTPGPSPTS